MRTVEHDWYAVLGVARNATAGEIKAAHRRLARNLHPDVNPEAGAHERMSLVNRARDVLLDTQMRSEFDVSGFSSAGFADRGPESFTPAPPDPRDWYEFIGVEPGTDPSEMVLALRWKRDWIRAQNFSDEDYTRQSLFWREASETLTSPRSRRAYDLARGPAFSPGGDRDAPPDWYTFLGLRKRAPIEDIADRVTELSRQPAPGKQYTRDLQEAWRVLRDADCRAEYDEALGLHAHR